MLHAMPKAATRVRRPRISPIPPKNSAAMARKANGAGMCIMSVKKCIVPESPYPPNQPRILRAVGKENNAEHEPENGESAIVRCGHQLFEHRVFSLDAEIL